MHTLNPMGSLISISSCLGNEIQCKLMLCVTDDYVIFGL